MGIKGVNVKIARVIGGSTMTLPLEYQIEILQAAHYHKQSLEDDLLSFEEVIELCAIDVVSQHYPLRS